MQLSAAEALSMGARRGLTLAAEETSLPPISALYRSILDGIRDGVYFVGLDRAIVFWNRAAERISGYSADEVVGRRCADGILRHCTEDGTALCETGSPLKGAMIDGKSQEVEAWIHHKKGHRVPVTVHATAVRDDAGRIVGSVEVFSDNSRKIVAIEQAKELNRLAFIDELTGVGNRRSVDIRLRELFADPIGMGMPVGVLFIDVDHFKAFNDRHGHATGDRVLRAVAETLGENLRTYDYVGRWGGEEFVVVTAASSLVEMQLLAARLRSLVEQTDVDVKGESLGVTVSIGGALARPGDEPDSLVSRADGHLYESKRNGRNRSTVR